MTYCGIHCSGCKALWDKIYLNRNKKKKKITAPYNTQILWRYSKKNEELLLIDLSNHSSDIYYRAFLEDEDVNTFRTKRIQCPNCLLDFSFEKINPKYHTCNSKVNKKYYKSQINDGISLLRSFNNMKVFITCSRYSGFTINSNGYENLWDNHNYRYTLGLKFLNKNENNPDVVHGQQYLKIGSLNSTIISANFSSPVTYPFKCIHTHMNDHFSGSEHIFICLRVVADFCASPYYFLEFIKTLTDAVRNKTSILLFNWSDETDILNDDEGVEIQLNDIYMLLQEDTFFPLTAWLKEIKVGSPKSRLIMENNDPELYAYRFLNAMYTTFIKRIGNLPANGRNVMPNP